MTWIGWVRPRAEVDDWRWIAEGDTLVLCHQRLLVEAKRLGLQGGYRLMTGGRHPGEILAAGRALPHPGREAS
jgi:hypothetical protein